MFVSNPPVLSAQHLIPPLIAWHWSLTLDDIIGRPVAIVVLVLLALIVRWGLHHVIDRLVRRASAGLLPERFVSERLGNGARRVQRATTMGDLLKSLVTGALVAIFGTMVLSELGIDIAPILAGAGIIGIALGFGAQSLVKDFLSGIFLIFEDQYGVGDVVDTGVASGSVEAVSLRVTRLRDVNGTVWYVPNGEILRVGNMSQNWSRAVVDVQVGYGEDLARVQHVLRDVAHDMWQDEDFHDVITEQPEVTGVEAMAPEAITVRVLVKTRPMQQWSVARHLRQRIKARFDAEGIRMPYTQQLVFPGATPPGAAGAPAASAAAAPSDDAEESTGS